MRAWVARRRAGGALLADPALIGEAPAPFELLIVEVTDQGKRRPTKVARLFPADGRVAVAELVAPKLVWFKKWDFVLSGTEHALVEGGKLGAAQTWLCKLQTPSYAVGFKARHTHKDGVEIARRALMDRYAQESRGRLLIEVTKEPALGRHAICAQLAKPGGNTASTLRPHALLDVEIDWMSEERFSLTGFDPRAPSGDRPARLLRHGWLCEFEIDDPTDGVPRPPRGTDAQR